MQDGNKNCVLSSAFVHLNSTGPLRFNLEDMLLIGMQYFRKFNGMHFNFDDSKLTFLSPTKEVIKPSPVG